MPNSRGTSSCKRVSFASHWLSLTRGMTPDMVAQRLGKPHYQSNARRTWYYRVKKGEEDQIWKVVFSGRRQVISVEPRKATIRKSNPNRFQLLPSHDKRHAKNAVLFRRKWHRIRAGMHGGQIRARLGDPHFTDRRGDKKWFYYNVKGAHGQDLWDVTFCADELIAANPAIPQFHAAPSEHKSKRHPSNRRRKYGPAHPARADTQIVRAHPVEDYEEGLITDQMERSDPDTETVEAREGELLTDLVATQLMRDIEALTNLGIEWDKATFAAKTGGAALAGYQAFTGHWLSALAIGVISLLSGAIAVGYKRIKLMEVREKWIRFLMSLSTEQLAYLGASLSQKYPLLVNHLQQLLASGS